MLEAEKKWYDKKRFVLPLLIFFYPIGLYGLFKGKAIAKKDIKIGLAVGVPFLFMFIVFSSLLSILGSEVSKENKERIALIDTQIKKGNIEEALIQINKHLKKYSNEELEKKKKQIEKAKNIQEIELTLATMNDARFEKLKNGTLEEKFFKDESINAFFIKQLLANAGRKKELTEAWELERKQRDLARQQAARRSKIEESFSKYNGSHRGLVKYVESAMHDPDSFEHVETKVYDKETYLLVRMIYRGNNKFGAKVKESVLAKVDFDGNVLSIEQ